MLFFAFTSYLPAEPIESLSQQEAAFAQEAAPSSFVNNVNVIFGTFHHNGTDLIVPGPTPLHLTHSYSSDSFFENWMGKAAMSTNYPTRIISSPLSEDNYQDLSVEESSGSFLKYVTKRESFDKKKRIYYLDPKVIQKGLTNCGGGAISARNNLKNSRFIMEASEKAHENKVKWIAEFGDGSYRKYHSIHVKKEYHDDEEIKTEVDLEEFHEQLKRDNRDAERKKRPAIATLDYERKPSGNHVFYGYDKEDMLQRIKTTGEDEDDTLNWLYFDYDQDKRRATIKSSNGKRCDYHFMREKAGKFGKANYVRKISSSDMPEINFDYTKVNGKYALSRIDWAGGRFLEVEYDHKGRVKVQNAPAGKNGKKQLIYEFEYDDKKTTSYDGLGRKTIYAFGSSKRLKQITYFLDKEILRQQRFYWGQNEPLKEGIRDSSNQGYLTAKAVLNKQGKAVSSCVFKYDEYGNIVKETLYGALSGKKCSLFSLDEKGHPADSAIEQYQKYYEYSNDAFHLLKKQAEDNGPEIAYEYKKGTDLIVAKFTRHADAIKIREFFEYDKTAVLIEKIVDDGVSRDPDNLKGVSERHITKIVPVEKRGEYGVGKPKTVSEYYLDMKTKERVLLQRKEFSYNTAGLVTREKLYNSHDEPVYTLFNEYDEKGRLIESVDALHRKVKYGYDDDNNRIYEHVEGSHVHRKFRYDTMNRLIEEHEKHDDGRHFKTTHEYDVMGNKISTSDHFENETHFVYDDLNRLVKTVFPSTKGNDSPSVLQEYDLQNNVITLIDANKNITRKTYNSRSQPVTITYPDDSKEEFEYNLNGTLKYKWDRSGTRTSYTYDWQRRPIQIAVYDADDKCISICKNSYNAFHLLSSTDPMGIATHYSYDDAGREIEITRGDSRTSFKYDSLGRKFTTRHWYGSESKEWLATIQEFDLANRVIRECRQNGDGTLLSEIKYEYDILNNRTKTISAINSTRASLQEVVYNSSSLPIELTDELGSTTKIQYDFSYKNSLGQKVLQKTTIDPLGNKLIQTDNAVHNPSTIRQEDKHGTITSCTKFFYDAHGNKIRELHEVIIDGKVDHEYLVKSRYDSLHRLLELIEDESKTTRYEYYKNGNLKKITKPDGVTLKYTYDAIGRLKTLTSSDDTISYSYEYDENGNPIRIEDHVHKTVQKRTFDALNRLTQENFGALTVHRTYDALGRIRRFQLPDNSFVEYDYSGGQLSQVSRLNEQKKEQYCHQYNSIDLKGAVLKATAIGDVGNFFYDWDKKGRPIEFKTDFWKEELLRYDKAGNLCVRTFKDALSKIACEYSYDSLYQLTEEFGVASHFFKNDSLCNRLKKDKNSYDIDHKNRLQRTSKVEFSYDKNGNMIQKREAGIMTYYSYDALDRLIQVESPKFYRIQYTYDSAHRRLSKKLFHYDGSHFQEVSFDRYFFFGEREVGACNKHNEITQFRMLGRGLGGDIGAAVALEIENKLYCPIHDHRGNVVTLIDARSSKLVETIRYTSFGEVFIFDASNQPKQNSISPWLFASKRYEQETGLSYFGRRYFSAEIGRWVTPDPIGFSDGPNLYAFVRNRPHVFLDLTGLFSEGSSTAPS